MNDDQTLAPLPEPLPDDSIDVLELLTQFVIEWRFGVLAAVLVFVAGALYTYSIKPQFEANATLLPQAKPNTNDLATFFSQQTPGDVYTGLLTSRSVQDLVVDQLHLLQHYRTNSRGDARAALGGSSRFSVGRDTLITIQVRDEDAKTAQAMANAYVDALEKLQNQMSLHSADVRSRFLSDQLAHETQTLAAAESDLEKAQLATGVVQPEQQTSIGLGAIAAVRSQITQLQVQLSSLLLGESEENPQVKALRAQIAQLQGQEHTLESANGGTATGAAPAASRIPELNLDIQRKERVVRFHETLLNSIATQIENARLAEGLNGLPFLVVDRAVVPERKAYPNRKLLLTFSAALAVVAGFAGIALRLFWIRVAALENSDRLRRIRASFSLRRRRA